MILLGNLEDYHRMDKSTAILEYEKMKKQHDELKKVLENEECKKNFDDLVKCYKVTSFKVEYEIRATKIDSTGETLRFLMTDRVVAEFKNWEFWIYMHTELSPKQKFPEKLKGHHY